jgi:methyl-accepting chemotaxis protein
MVAVAGVTLLGNSLPHVLNLLKVRVEFVGDLAFSFLVFICAAAVSLLVAVFLGTYSGKKVEQIVAAISAMAKGDLTHKLNIPGKDEFAWMAYEYNCAAEAVTNIIESITTASHTLAETASDQAASLEEISSSLEEMTVMAKQSAENCTQADVFGKEVRKIVAQAENLMADLTTSMETTAKSSEDIRKINKKIDAIAFQTNAVNAAVEAGNAGEAGAGFAVVAAEVKKLALKAGEEAKESEQFIDATASKIDAGLAMVKKTAESITGVATGAIKIGELVTDIAEASNQQAQGIEQLSVAVNEIDQNTQQNAGSAQDLRTLVGGFKIEKDDLI